MIMSIAKVFKDIINKFNKPKAPAASRWPELEYQNYVIKQPFETTRVAASMFVQNGDCLPTKIVESRIARDIADELLKSGVLIVGKSKEENPNGTKFYGEIEVVLRR